MSFDIPATGKDLGERLAPTFGMSFTNVVPSASHGVKSIIFVNDLRQVADYFGGPHIRMGNHGDTAVSDSSWKPSRRGFAVVSHELKLPHLFFDAAGIGAVNLTNLITIGMKILDANHPRPALTLTEFSRQGGKLVVPPESRFSALCEAQSLPQGQELLTPNALRILDWLAGSFDVEFWGDHAIIYCNYGDLVTNDPKIWAWAFSAISRVIDLLRLWGAGAEFGQHWPNYTDEWVERPAKRDIVLGFLKPKRSPPTASHNSRTN